MGRKSLFDGVFGLFAISALVGVGISYSKLYLFHIMLLILVGTTVISNKPIFFFKNPLPTKLHGFFYAFYGWYLMSILWSPQPETSFVYTIYILCGASVALSLVFYCTTKERLLFVFRCAAFAVVAQLAVAVLEVFTDFRWPISPFSPFNGLFGRPYTPFKIPTADLWELFSSVPTGFSWNQNDLAALMVLITPFVLVVRRTAARLLLIGMIAVVALKTESRGGILSFLGITLVYMTLRLSKLKLAFITGGGLSVLLMVALSRSGYDMPIFVKKLSDAVSSVEMLLLEDVPAHNSIGVRQQLLANAFNDFDETLGLGFSAGGSKLVQQQSDNTEGVTSLHNFWAELFLEGGPLFFFGFALWFIVIIATLFRHARKCADRNLAALGFAAALSCIALVPAVVPMSSSIYWLPMWFLFGFAIAVINVSVSEERRLKELRT